MKWTVAIDLQKSARQTAEAALSWARPGDELELVYCDDTQNVAGLFQDTLLTEAALRVFEEAMARHAVQLKALADEMDAVSPDITVRARHMRGEPVERLLALEAGTDGLMVATHGRTGFARFWLGSVAERLVRLAHVPVLVLRLTAVN